MLVYYTSLKKFMVAAGQIGKGSMCITFPGKRGRDPTHQASSVGIGCLGPMASHSIGIVNSACSAVM